MLEERKERGEKAQKHKSKLLSCYLEFRFGSTGACRTLQKVSPNVIVHEDPFWIKSRSQGQELVQARVDFPEFGCFKCVGLGPVGTTTELEHDPLKAEPILLTGNVAPVGSVHDDADEAHIVTMGGAQQDVVPLDEADFDGEVSHHLFVLN